jgi:small redox-active disulfide protein 2
MKIEILGMGCHKCVKLYANTVLAVKEMGLTAAEVLKVEDFQKIREYGVLSTPAVAVDGKVISAGKLLSTEEIKRLLA